MRNLNRLVITAMSILLVIIAGAYAGDWISEDINTSVDGATEYDEASGKWTIEAAGVDIWGTADGLRLVYQEVSGDFEISCQVITIENTNSWAKGGVMARASNANNAAYAFSFVTVGNGTSLQWRLTEGDRCWPDGGGIPGGAPYYVKVVREGDMFFGFRSEDGESWEENHTVGAASEVEVAMDDPILVGLALTSHSAGAICAAEFDSLEATFDEKAVKPKDKLAATWAKLKR